MNYEISMQIYLIKKEFERSKGVKRDDREVEDGDQGMSMVNEGNFENLRFRFVA